MPVGSRHVGERKELEDPLAYLPYKEIAQYDKNQDIYDESQPSNGIYLVVQGKVKVTRPASAGKQVVIDVYQANDLFGESGLLDLKERGERATALARTQLMFWTTAEIEHLMERQPELGIALIQMMAYRSVELADRLESLACEKIPDRVSRSLIRFAERLGQRMDDGALRIPPMTHQLLSDYIGTSREIVTSQMNNLRRNGYMRYSRKGIELFADALKEKLRKSHIGGAGV